MSERVFQDFGKIIDNTGCFFAKMSRNVYASELKFKQDANVLNIDTIFDEFKNFNDTIDENTSDALIVGFYQTDTITSINDLAKLTKNFLWDLCVRDAGQDHASAVVDSADKENWWFVFQGNRYLPSVFSHLHPLTSPRNTQNISAVFFMFQPVQSFDRKTKPPETEIDDAARQRIRDVHIKKNMPYDFELVASYYEGLKVIESLEKNTTVKWWQTNLYR